MKGLITGGNGQLATAIKNAHRLGRLDHRFISLGHEQLDICDPKSIAQAFDTHEPEIVINTAAYTDVDGAESHRELAKKCNVDGTKNLAKACEKAKIPLIHFSTDYVFDGKQKTPYTEKNPCHPINYYGETKYQSEQVVQEYLDTHLILRISGVYSAVGKNFLKTIYQLLRERPEISVVSDQITCQTEASDIAAVTFQLLDCYTQRNTAVFAWGTYHFASTPARSWFDFANCIADCCNSEYRQNVARIIPTSTEAFGRPAPRPLNTVLDCQKIKDTFGVKQPLAQIGLERALRELILNPKRIF